VRITLSKEARNDLLSIRDYIRDDLLNPDAAQQTIAALKKGVQGLSSFPERGTSLDTILPIHTDFRFVLCKSYRIFYVCNHDTVEVVRILHNLQDYMRALFIK